MTEHYTESQGSGNYWRTVMVTGDQANQSKKDTVRALDVGYEIHRAFTVGNFSQYTWWYIRRCYGLIMETDFSNKLSIPNKRSRKNFETRLCPFAICKIYSPGRCAHFGNAKARDKCVCVGV